MSFNTPLEVHKWSKIYPGIVSGFGIQMQRSACDIPIVSDI